MKIVYESENKVEFRYVLVGNVVFFGGQLFIKICEDDPLNAFGLESNQVVEINESDIVIPVACSLLIQEKIIR